MERGRPRWRGRGADSTIVARWRGNIQEWRQGGGEERGLVPRQGRGWGIATANVPEAGEESGLKKYTARVHRKSVRAKRQRGRRKPGDGGRVGTGGEGRRRHQHRRASECARPVGRARAATHGARRGRQPPRTRSVTGGPAGRLTTCCGHAATAATGPRRFTRRGHGPSAATGPRQTPLELCVGAPRARAVRTAVQSAQSAGLAPTRFRNPGCSRGDAIICEASSRDPFVFSTLRQPRCIEWMALVDLMVTL